MTPRKFQSQSQLLASLVLPIALGLVMFLLVELLIDREVISGEMSLRYLTGHPISRITTFMFLIGLGALLVIANNVFDQFCNCGQISLGPPPKEGSEPADSGAVDSLSTRAAALTEKLNACRRPLRSQYMWRRLSDALGFMERTDSASGLEDELKYLADLDRERLQRRYALVRIVIWATPMLGFLGTVLGISQALSGIEVGPDNDFQQMLGSLRSSLYVAFDTTAVSLTLSMVLMFLQFFIDRFEIQLLDSVDRRTHDELLPLVHGCSATDPHTHAVERIGNAVIASSHELVRQQKEMLTHVLQKMHLLESAPSQTDAIQVPDEEVDSVQAILQRLSNAIDDLKRRAQPTRRGLVPAALDSTEDVQFAGRIIQFRDAVAGKQQIAAQQDREKPAQRDAA